MSYINPTVPPAADGPSTAHLGLIRMSFLAGVLLFGAIAWLLDRAGKIPLAPDADTPLTAIMPYALGALLAGAIAMRFVAAKAENPGQRAGYLLAGWGIGQAAGMLGGVHWMFTGHPRWYVIGLFVFLSALVLLPLRRE